MVIFCFNIIMHSKLCDSGWWESLFLNLSKLSQPPIEFYNQHHVLHLFIIYIKLFTFLHPTPIKLHHFGSISKPESIFTFCHIIDTPSFQSQIKEKRNTKAYAAYLVLYAFKMLISPLNKCTSNPLPSNTDNLHTCSKVWI